MEVCFTKPQIRKLLDVNEKHGGSLSFLTKLPLRALAALSEQTLATLLPKPVSVAVKIIRDALASGVQTSGNGLLAKPGFVKIYVTAPKGKVVQAVKRGGLLPILPFLPLIFGALGAAGAVTGGVATAVKAANDKKAADKQLEEQKRHNAKLESGSGMYLNPKTGGCIKKNSKKKRAGLGMYLAPYGTV